MYTKPQKCFIVSLALLCVLCLASYFVIHAKAVFADQSLQVSATVPPRTSDYQFDFSQTSGQTNVQQDQILTYQITYGARASAGQTTVLTLTADYSHDSISGIDILDYVPGSASDGYGNAPPVVDLINRKIQWTITLPNGVTDQTVTFSLQTNSNYTGSATVPLTVTASAQTPYFSLGQRSNTVYYTYNPGSATPTPTSTTPPATATPLPQTPTTTPQNQLPTITPAPTVPLKPPLQITNVSITQVSQTSVTVSATTNLPTGLVLQYGTSQGALTKTLASPASDITHVFTMSSLSPDTTYYFRIVAGSLYSDIYVVHTAKTSTNQQIQNQTVTFSSNGILLTTPMTIEQLTQHLQTIVLPRDENFEVTFSLSSSSVKSLLGIVQSESVLGISNFFTTAQNETVIPVFEKTPGVFTLQMRTPNAKGMYALRIRIQQTDGSINQFHIATIKVVNPFTIRSQTTQQPLNQARVFFYHYNYLTHTYIPLVYYDTRPRNPLFSDSNGIVHIVLPQGKYKADIAAVGFVQRSITFSINPAITDFPLVSLQPSSFSLGQLLQYLANALSDMLIAVSIFLQLISSSYEPIGLFAVAALCMLVVTSILTIIKLSLRKSAAPEKFPPAKYLTAVVSLLLLFFKSIYQSCLFLVCILCIFLLFLFGFTPVFPWLALTVLTLLLWFFFIRL